MPIIQYVSQTARTWTHEGHVHQRWKESMRRHVGHQQRTGLMKINDMADEAVAI